MPDPRLVGLHELRALLFNLNEAILRSSSSGAHLSHASDIDEGIDDLEYIKTTLESDLVPRCVRIVNRLQSGKFKN